MLSRKTTQIVRRTVGYLRYDSEQELTLLNEIYGYQRLYTNFFLPVFKLKEKTRVGSKVRKFYDEPKTPYQRVLESNFVTEANKQRLKDTYAKLNSAHLKREVSRL